MLREDAAELDAGHVGLDRADGAAELGRSRHLRVESFDVRRAAAQPEPDDRGVARRLSRGGRCRAGAQQIGEREAAQSQGADLQEIAARAAVTCLPLPIAPNLEHGMTPFPKFRAILPRRPSLR